MPRPFSDRLFDAIHDKGTGATVNLDPVCSSLPKCFAAAHAPADRFDPRAAVADILEFGRGVIRAVAPHVPVIKLNIAYFECFGPPGLDAYFALIAEARAAGLLVIGDVKRGDVGHTAAMYAQGHLADQPGRSMPDAITINGYFGRDGVQPFVEVARRRGKGVFVLVRTSNDSAASVQDVQTTDGRPVHDLVARLVADWNTESGTIGECGYGAIGAVVATRNASDARALRQTMPKSIFLVPGYGAQGGRAEDFAPYFDANGLGALVAAGRSVIFAHDRDELRARHGNDWQRCIEHACREFVADLRRVIPLRG